MIENAFNDSSDGSYPVKAGFFRPLTGRAVQCRLCSHFCSIAEGRTGICGVRQNRGGELYSLVYGRPAALQADPIEKKPLYHFLPGSSAFSIGTMGCNFRCKNCHNYQITQAKVKIDDDELAPPKDIAAGAARSGCLSVAYTYNEPTIFTEYALDIMKQAKVLDLKNVWVTNGYMSDECLDAILPLLDAANVDLKSMDSAFYSKVCRARLEPILANLKRIKSSGVHLEITTLLIPTLSDDSKMLLKISEFISSELGPETVWHVSPFSPEISWKLKDLPATTLKNLAAAVAIGRRAGLKYVYAPGIEENTYCPSCGELAIKRKFYDIERSDHNGHCRKCGADLDLIL